MKKILFTLLLLVGGFVAQAQDITIKVVTNNNNDKIAVGSNDDSLCFDNVTVVKTEVYSWNNDSGELRLNGDLLQTYSSFAKIGTNTYFVNYTETLYEANFLNAVRGEVTFTNDNGQLSIN